MAYIEKTINIDVESRDALAGIGKIDKGLSGLDKSSKEASKAVGFMSNAFNKLGVAIKATGIGLVIAALAKLSEIFMQNQRVADLFNTAFEAVSIAFNDFVSFIVDNSGAVVDFFKSIFENPLESVKELGRSIKANITERFESFLDTLGFLASAVKKVFSGDFTGALEDVKSAGKESIDVLTGVNNTVDKAKEVIDKTTSSIVDYTNKTIKSAKENVKLANQAELAAVKNQGLIEKYDRQAEQLRQVRDDESKSIEERIKANEDLAKVLDDQEKAMKENAAIAVASAKAELDKNKDNIQLQKAYAEALNEQAAIEAQITGFRSEQQTNANSLLREQKDLQNELALIGKSERDIQREELKQQYLEQKELIDREVKDEEEKNKLLLLAEEDFKTKLKELNDGFDAEDLATKKANAEAEIKLEKDKVQSKQQTLDAVVSLLGAETSAGKAALVAKQLLSAQEMINEARKTITFASLTGARSSASIAEGTAQTAKIGFPQNIPMLIGYALQAAGIVSAITSAIGKTKSVASSLGGGGASTPSIQKPQATVTTPPSFNIVGASDTNQLADAIGGQTQQPVQAYVVANDVTSAQSMDRNIVEGATLG